MMTFRFFIPLLSFIFLFGCGSYADSQCSSISMPALSIEIKDKATDSPISCATTVTVIDNDFSEELENPASEECDDALIYEVAFGREGLYDIHIAKAGYHDWDEYVIEVSSSMCNVNTVYIEALLEQV